MPSWLASSYMQLALQTQPSVSFDWTSGLFGLANTAESEAALLSVFNMRTIPLNTNLPPPSPLFQASSNNTSTGLLLSPMTTQTQGSGPSIFPSSAPSGSVNVAAAGTVQSPTPSTSNTRPPPGAKPMQDSPATSKLSQKDLEAFRASKFILGQIPETAPPPDLC